MATGGRSSVSSPRQSRTSASPAWCRTSDGPPLRPRRWNELRPNSACQSSGSASWWRPVRVSGVPLQRRRAPKVHARDAVPAHAHLAAGADLELRATARADGLSTADRLGVRAASEEYGASGEDVDVGERGRRLGRGRGDRGRGGRSREQAEQRGLEGEAGNLDHRDGVRNVVAWDRRAARGGGSCGAGGRSAAPTAALGIGLPRGPG